MLVPKVDSKKFLDLPNRKSFCLILQIQTGYSKLKDYRYKLGQCDSIKCTCREPEHFLMDCPNYQHYREHMQLKLSSQLGLNFLYAHTLLSCSLNLRSPYLPSRTDKSRQEPSRADKRHFYAFFRLKYYILDHIYTLYIQISYMIAFAAPAKQ